MMTHEHALKNGTVLNNYIIVKILGAGGFGITYLAKDKQLGMEVVIKEYFPSDLAIRNNDSTIISKSSNTENDFKKGMQRFEEEAQTLAKFNHPSIVKILGYFEANNTAYFVMEYEEGIDLSQYMKNKTTPFTQEEILGIMMPILEGLKEVHRHNYLHRDIKPGNILLRSNKSPVLIDFGASKLAIGEASKSITSMLTEGYAPLEQYNTDIKQQGAFTDIYAIAAVIYKMITGEVPPSAQTRSYNLLQDGEDPFNLLVAMKLSGYDTSFLKAVDRALSIKAKDRAQDVQEFQADIAGELQPVKNNTEKLSDASSNTGKYTSIIIFVLLLISGGYFYMQQNNVGPSKSIDKPKSGMDKDTNQEELRKAQKELEDLKRKNGEEVRQRIVEKKRVKKEKTEQHAKIEQERQKLETEKKDKLEKERIEKENKKFPLPIKVTPFNAEDTTKNYVPNTDKEKLEAYVKFTQILNVIESKYVDKVNTTVLVNKALKGLMQNLTSSLKSFDTNVYKDLLALTKGEEDTAKTYVPNTNKEKLEAYVKFTQILNVIESKYVDKVNTTVLVNKALKGLMQNLDSYSKFFDAKAYKDLFSHIKDRIKIQSVYAKKIEDNILYLHVSSFDQKVVDSVKDAIKEHNNFQGIILDLRNNPGGLLDQAVGLVDLFVDKGIIVSQEGQIKTETIEYKAHKSNIDLNTPMAVLVNAESASASEIVSGSLQDLNRSVIVGEQTFGHGSVQVVMPVGETEGIKLTVARLNLPSGRTIQNVGVTPDVIVHLGKGDSDLSRKENFKNNKVYKDRQLKAAVDILKHNIGIVD